MIRLLERRRDDQVLAPCQDHAVLPQDPDLQPGRPRLLRRHVEPDIEHIFPRPPPDGVQPAREQRFAAEGCAVQRQLHAFDRRRRDAVAPDGLDAAQGRRETPLRPLRARSGVRQVNAVETRPAVSAVRAREQFRGQTARVDLRGRIVRQGPGRTPGERGQLTQRILPARPKRERAAIGCLAGP